jgi:1,2-phenylacetyl-CoA epoxidase catalytic subunit
MKNQLKIFLIFPILLILIYCIPDISKKAKEQNDKNNLLRFAQFLVSTELYYLKIVSTQPENGTNIGSTQAITITFNKDVRQCWLNREQPTIQTLTNITINGKNVTINPQSGNWGSSGQTLKIFGTCFPYEGQRAEISLNYTIN